MGERPSGAWHQNWGLPLPRDEQERMLLREVESSAYPDRPIPFLANRLRTLTKMASAWLPTSPTWDQRALALALSGILKLGVQALGVGQEGVPKYAPAP